jgi:WD40 repeat protein
MSSAGPRRVSECPPSPQPLPYQFAYLHLGEVLASAGDDGNVILWVRSETHHPTFGSDGLDDKETWRTKHMCRSLGTEIYDLAWSPDASFFIIGSMDNVARIYNAVTGRHAFRR